MDDAIFLSASVPDPKRAPRFAESADTVAIAAAVSALAYVILGRRLLVWGGHPAITLMIWMIAEGLHTDYGSWVRLYQSEYFEDEYPEDNSRFGNVTYTKAVNADRDQSLFEMRRRMLTDFNVQSAVFIGGMYGVTEEFNMIKKYQPAAKIVPVVSTGGATADIARSMGTYPADLLLDRDYVALFYRHLDISLKEQRRRTIDDQSSGLRDRDGPHS